MDPHETTPPTETHASAHIPLDRMLHDGTFMGRVAQLREAAAADEAENEALRRIAETSRDDKTARLERLNGVAAAIAQSANRSPELSGRKTQFFTQELKGTLGRIMNNRGDLKHVPAERGWVISEATSDKATSQKANLVNNGGIGLALTESGRLYLYLKQSGPKLKRKDRKEIERRTFLPQNGKILPELTLLPRSGEEPRPTLTLTIDDPENQRATNLVIGQCFEALARFVQQHNL